MRQTFQKAHQYWHGIMLLRTANEASRLLQMAQEEVESRSVMYSLAEVNVLHWLKAEGMTIEQLTQYEVEERTGSK